jgi:hypothetical protein
LVRLAKTIRVPLGDQKPFLSTTWLSVTGVCALPSAFMRKTSSVLSP